jgi:hypothetical protein
MKKVINVHKQGFIETMKNEKFDSIKMENIKKRIKVFSIFTLILLLMNFSSYSQTPLPKKAKLKTINYKYLYYDPAQEYPSAEHIVIASLPGYGKKQETGTRTTVASYNSFNEQYLKTSDSYIQNKTAVGYVYKKQFVENQNLTFIDYSNANYRKDAVSGGDTIISGKYFVKNGIAYIDGIWKNRNSFIKGVFAITNNEDKIGLTANPKSGYNLKIVPVAVSYYKSPTCQLKRNVESDNQPDNETVSYYMKIVYQGRTLETSVSSELIKKYGLFAFNNLITNSRQVKLSYENGSVFTGTVESRANDNAISPRKGECKYSTGEIFTGDWNDSYIYGMPFNGKWTFADGSVEEGFWFEKYGLKDYEWNTKIPTNISPTEKHTRVINIYNEKQEKERQKQLALQEEKRQRQLALQEKERQRQELFNAAQQHNQYLLSKYGNYWGNLIIQREFAPGMTKEMVLEFTSNKVYKISKSIRNGKSVERWKFDETKFMLELANESSKLDEKGREAIGGLLVIMQFAEMLGIDIKSQFPDLIFTNGVLTDVLQN